MAKELDARPLRIAHFVDYLMPTMGYQEFLLPKWNARHGHDVHIFTSDRYTPVPNYSETWGKLLGPRHCGVGVEVIEGVTVHRLPCLEVRARPWLFGLERAVRQSGPDALFCHGTASPTAFRLPRLAEQEGLPLLMDNHMCYVAQNRRPLGRLYYAGLKFLSRRVLDRGSVHRFLGVAQECCEFLAEEQGLRRDRIDCLPLGVDTELFHADHAAAQRRRKELDIPEEARVVVQTGKVTPTKGAHLLAQAMAPLMQQNADVHLVYVGGGSSAFIEKEIRTPLRAANVGQRLRLVPFVPARELSGVYCMADLCVYPAANSMSCLEVAACGKAVLITDLPASRWRNELGVGRMFRDGDVEDLRRKIDELISDRGELQRLGHSSKEAVFRHFSYDTIAAEAERLMREALGREVSSQPAA